MHKSARNVAAHDRAAGDTHDLLSAAPSLEAPHRTPPGAPSY
jgi:hypothetical protein